MFNLYPWRAVFQGFLAIAIILPGLPIASVPAPELNPKTKMEVQTDNRESAAVAASPVELAYTEVLTLPQFLPYSLDYAFEVADVGDSPATTAINVALPPGTMPESTLSQELVRLFYFQADMETWQQLPTQRTFEGGVWYLQAPAGAPGIYAAALSTTSDYGDYQNPWQPTVNAAQVDLFTGAVQWSYPLDLPGGRSGLHPGLSLSYNSGLVDETRGAMNPQTPGIGIGWTLGMAYIEREIQRDAHGTPKVFMDAQDKFRLVLNGVSSKLVCVDGQTPCVEFRAEDERYWRIQRLGGAPNESQYPLVNGIKGEYWLVTTPEGRQYRFGWSGDRDLYPAGNEGQLSAWYMLGQETWTTAKSVVPYIWRWNLDQISDPQGNIASFFYAREYNDTAICKGGAVNPYTDCWYAVKGLGTLDLGEFYLFSVNNGPWPAESFRDQHGAQVISQKGYVRGGHLLWASYTRQHDAHDLYQVRIVTQTQPSGVYYSADHDSHATTDRVVQQAQTFWSKRIITAIEVRAGAPPDGRPVLWRYTLQHEIHNGHLLLKGIQQTAADGSLLPRTTFHYLDRSGYSGTCVAGDEEGAWKPWLDTIINGYGGTVNFNYTAPLGLPGFQDGQTLAPRRDGKCWYRYRLREMMVDPGVGVPQRTVYEYLDLAGNPHPGTWVDDEFRGHPRVRVKQRDANGAVVNAVEHDFFQGDGGPAISACGVTLADSAGLQGRAYRSVSYAADGTSELARRETAYLYRDLGGGRRFVGVQAECTYPAGASGPHSRSDYEYDEYGNVTREVHYGDVSQSGDEYSVTRSYLPNLERWLLRSPAQETLRNLAGAVQRQTFYAYDGQTEGAAPTAGKVTQVRQGLGSVWTTTQMQYDAWGNPEVITDALGHATHTEYDPVSRQFPVRVTNARGHETSTQWDLRLGIPRIITDANGAATHLAYDSFGRVTAVTPPGDAFPVVKYTYPDGDALSAPFVVKTETRVDAYLPSPQYQTAWTFYDGLGRAIQTQIEAENAQLVLQSTAYDALGRPVTVTLPYTVSAGGGLYHPPNWDMLLKTVTSYDELGRVTQVRAADGSRTRQAYRAWQTLTLDAAGHQTAYESDGLGHLIAVREYHGTYPAPDWNAPHPAETTYQYDPQGNLTRVLDSMGNLTRITYDPLGRKTWMADPSMGEWVYEYDDVGNLIAQTDAEGQTLTFEYDVLNRLTHKFHAGDLLAEYGYDQELYGIGRRTMMTDTSGTASWQYDVQGRTLAETKTIAGAGTFVTAWDYDAAGRVITTTYPTGEAVRTAYNLRGLPTGVTGLDAYLVDAAYNAAGQPLWQDWGNTLRTTYAYDTDTLRLQSLQVSGGLLNLGYQYDLVGNVKVITDTANAGQAQTFTYDARDRLLTAHTTVAGQGQYHETYGYDLMGNIITRTVGGDPRAYTYGRPPDPGETVTPTLPHIIYLPIIAHKHDSRVSTIRQPFAVVATSDGFRAAYDLNGNMTLRVEVSGTETVTYTQAWNAENRLSVVTNTVSGAVTRFVYDGDGNRVLREQPDGSVTAYLGAVEVTLSGTERLTTSYYFAGAQRIAMREGVTLTYLHGDHLGSASLATNAGGTQVSAMRYTPFGETRYGDAPTDFRFTGQREEGFGLYDYGARFYSPGLGRFVSADVIVPGMGNPQSFNRYSYVLNSPLRYTDPTGHAYCPPEAGARCIMEDEPPPRPLPIRFVGDWPAAARMQVMRGAQAVANALLKVFLAERSRHPGTSSALTAAVAPQNMPLDAQSAFRMVFGQVTYRMAPQCGEAGCPNGVDPGAWAWSRIADLGEVWVNREATNFGGLAAQLNTVHELAHGIDLLGGGAARADLRAARIGYVGADGQDVQVAGGGWPGGYQRFPNGLFDWPWQQNTQAIPGEEFADMFIGWTYNHFAPGPAGDARYRWMNTNMPRWIALAVSGR